jgi:hypothetical protein
MRRATKKKLRIEITAFRRTTTIVVDELNARFSNQSQAEGDETRSAGEGSRQIVEVDLVASDDYLCSQKLTDFIEDSNRRKWPWRVRSAKAVLGQSRSYFDPALAGCPNQAPDEQV